MIALAFDTTTDRLSVAAGMPGGRVAVREATGARKHASLLVTLALEALAEVGAGPGAVDTVVLADGPGGFTGLRVAAAWAKGFSRDRGLPVRTASTLLVRAASARAEGRLVVGVGSALRNELFVGGYRFTVGGVSTVLEPMVLASGAALPIWEPVDAVVGDLPEADLRRWPFVGSSLVIGTPHGLPEAARLIELLDVPGGTRLVEDVGRWEPIYGRPAEAQAKWERTHGRTLPNSAGQPG